MDLSDAENAFRKALIALLQYGENGLLTAQRVFDEVFDEETMSGFQATSVPEQPFPSSLNTPGQASSSSQAAPEQVTPKTEPGQSPSAIIPEQHMPTASTSTATRKGKGKKRTRPTEESTTRVMRTRSSTKVECPPDAINMDKALTEAMNNQTQLKSNLTNLIQSAVKLMCPANQQLLLNKATVTELTLENQLENIDNIHSSSVGNISSSTPASLFQHYQNLLTASDISMILTNVLAWKASHLTAKFTGAYKAEVQKMVYGTDITQQQKSVLVCHGKVMMELVKRYGVCAMFMIDIFPPKTIKRIGIKNSMGFMDYAGQKQGFQAFMNNMETFVQQQLAVAMQQSTTTI
ncbi:unnamed protein product [Absidia cylindrospora]